MSLAQTLKSWWKARGYLSPATRVFLAVYALSVPLSWAVRYAPGELFVELESVEPLSKPVVNLVFIEGQRERALAAVVGDAGWPILDWTRSEALAPELSPLYAGRIDLGWAPWQALDSPAGLQLLVWQGDEQYYYRYGNGQRPVETKRAPRDALWLSPDGGIVRATRVYQASERAFGKRPYYKALWHVGRFVVARPEVERYAQADDGYRKVTEADAKNFLVFDARSGEPVSELATDMRVDGVYRAPRFEGLLYSSGYRLEALECDGSGCAVERVDLDSGFDDIRAAAYDPRYDRIAVCAGDSLYLYSGKPGADDIVCLGYGALAKPCDEVYVADDTTLFLGLVEGFYAVARFRWTH